MSYNNFLKVKDFFKSPIKKILNMYMLDFLMLLSSIGLIIVGLAILVAIIKEY